MVLQIPQPTSKMGQLSDFHYTVLAMQYNSSKVNIFLLSFQSFAKQVSVLGAGGTYFLLAR